MKYGFWPQKIDNNTASFRLRCKAIRLGLSRSGIETSLISSKPSEEDVVILCKRYCESTLKFIKNDTNRRYILDLCDNHFVVDGSIDLLKRANRLREVLKLVDKVIVSTDYLKQEVERESSNELDIVVIKDLIETPSYLACGSVICNPIQYILYQFVRNFLNSQGDNCIHLVWFGNAFGSFSESGMMGLYRVKDVLDGVQNGGVSLTVISNSRKEYKRISKDLNCPIIYVPWHQATISSLLSLHDAALIPVPKNKFTMAKTANRVETALVHGITVVSDFIPSYSEYADSIYLGDIAIELQRLLKGEGNINKAKVNIDENNSNVIRQWSEVLNEMEGLE
jgi:hypothetical protein